MSHFFTQEILPIYLIYIPTNCIFIEIEKSVNNSECLPVIGLLFFAGIQPREVRCLKWKVIDLEENSITARSQCSKTGCVRQVEILPALKHILSMHKKDGEANVCLPNWKRKWEIIREEAGFKGTRVQDVLRHTYASYFAERFTDLPRLQLNIGHRDLSLLRSRYINMRGIPNLGASSFFN